MTDGEFLPGDPYPAGPVPPEPPAQDWRDDMHTRGPTVTAAEEIQVAYDAYWRADDQDTRHAAADRLRMLGVRLNAPNARTKPAPAPLNHLPSDSASRKNIPLATGLLDYFPLALAEIARLSKFGNDKHNPGQPLHWSRDKSTDHADCILRHLADRGTIDPESGFLHDVGLGWRALANLQLALEKQAATTTVVNTRIPERY